MKNRLKIFLKCVENLDLSHLCRTNVLWSFSSFRYSSKGKELVTQMSAMFCLSLVTISLALVLSLALAEHTVGSSIFVVSKKMYFKKTCRSIITGLPFCQNSCAPFQILDSRTFSVGLAFDKKKMNVDIAE